MTELSSILESLDFQGWLEYEGVEFKLTRGKSGIQAMCKECPQCGNSHWKVYLNAESGIGNCFRCGTSFNKWSFIQARLQTNGRDTFAYVKRYAEENGWKAPVRKVEEAQPERTELVMPESVELPHAGRNLRYLTKRHITGEVAQYFKLRFCKIGSFPYLDAYGDAQVQDYSERVIIPVYDLDGSLVSFQGRDVTGAAFNKYLFPPGFASTGNILYNGQNAWAANHAVLGEGVFDAIAIKMALDTDEAHRSSVALATFGKSLGSEQLAKLKRLAENGQLKRVTIMWDGEGEALRAAVDAALACKACGLEADVALLPKDCDPNEVPPSVVLDCIANAVQVTPALAIKLKIKAAVMIQGAQS